MKRFYKAVFSLYQFIVVTLFPKCRLAFCCQRAAESLGDPDLHILGFHLREVPADALRRDRVKQYSVSRHESCEAPFAVLAFEPLELPERRLQNFGAHRQPHSPREAVSPCRART